MADFYADMAKMAKGLLAPTSQGGLGQGEIKLTHVIPGDSDPDKPWEPVTPKKVTQVLRGAVKGIGKELVGTEVGGTVLLSSSKLVSSDRIAICEVPSIPYTAGDVLSVDGVPVHILSYERIPAAGIAAAVKFIIRG